MLVSNGTGSGTFNVPGPLGYINNNDYSSVCVVDSAYVRGVEAPITVVRGCGFVDSSTRAFPRQNHLIQNRCMRTKGYLADACLQADKPCQALSNSTFRPEATAQAKAIRELAGRRSDLTSFNLVQWELAPAPDSLYAPDVEWANCDACEAPSPMPSNTSPWRIDIVVDDAKAIEVKRWSEWPDVGGTFKVQHDVKAQLGRYITKAGGLNITLVPDRELAHWGHLYGDNNEPNLGYLWCVWGDPDPSFQGQVYFAPVEAVPVDIRTAHPECNVPQRKRSVVVAAVSPWYQAGLVLLSSAAQAAREHILIVAGTLVPAIGYIIRYINNDGTSTDLYAGPADGAGGLDVTVQTPQLMPNGEDGAVVVIEQATGKELAGVSQFVLMDCL